MITTIEQIEAYIQKTKMKNKEPYAITYSEYLALSAIEDQVSVIERAFEYGMAKGYRMAKKEFKI